MTKVHKKIDNPNFLKLCDTIKNLLKVDCVKSNMYEASLDDSDKNNYIYWYDNSQIDMDIIKLDDFSESFTNYMIKERHLADFKQPKAVDAVCIDKNNNWYLVEFKNCPFYKDLKKEIINSNVATSIRNKMFDSLWMLFSMDSMRGTSLFPEDITDFARQHINYIIVVSSEKNTELHRLINESCYKEYTPKTLMHYIGYYFNDVYIITEKELRKFILNFKK